MRRHRLLATLLILVGLAGLLYILISLFVPSPRRLIFGVDKRSGSIRMAQQSIAFLPPHQYYRLNFEKRGEAAHHEGIAMVRSQEGVPVRVAYQLRFGVSKEQMPDAKRLVREGWSAWIRARVGEAVTALSARIPVDELVSPSARFSTSRNVVQRTVANHLAQSGLDVVSFQIERMEVDREALLAYKRAKLRRESRGAIGRVVVLGLDGADWELIKELIDDGHMPNLESLIDAGTSGTVQPIQPAIAPLAWTSLATGLPPDRHGVLDFTLEGDVPTSSMVRRAPAIWDIASAFGRPSQVVSWWSAWPPTQENLTVYDVPGQHVPAAIYPEELASQVRSVAIPEATIDFKQMSRFLNVTEPEFRRAIATGDPAEPIVALRSALSKTWSDHRAAVSLFERANPLLSMVLYGGTDEVNHLFSPYHPPLRQNIPFEEYRKYWPTVAAFYGEIDRLIGEWVKILPTDATLMIVSPHGMTWGRDRPRERPSGNSTITDHRRNGIFVAWGNRVSRSPQRRVLSAYDIAPTVLSILGLPASTEMGGEFLSWALTDVEPIAAVEILSYSDLVQPNPIATGPSIDPRGYLATLRTIGHLADQKRQTALTLQMAAEQPTDLVPVGSPQWGSYAYQNNLGVQLQRQGKSAEARRALQEAIDLNPNRSTPYLNFAMSLLEAKQFTAAENVFFDGIEKGVADPVQTILDFAAWHRSHGNHARAVAVLERGKALFPESAVIAANLGSAMAATQRYTDAVSELERALALQPTSTFILNTLGHIYVRRQDFGRALDYWNRSLAIDPAQPKIRQGVEALRTRL